MFFISNRPFFYFIKKIKPTPVKLPFIIIITVIRRPLPSLGLGGAAPGITAGVPAVQGTSPRKAWRSCRRRPAGASP